MNGAFNNPEAEEQVLAAMLLGNDAIKTAESFLTADCFYNPQNGTIFSAIQSVHDKGEPVDIVTVRSELTAMGHVGLVERLIELAQAYYTSVNTKYHAEEVRRLSDARRLNKSLITAMGKPLGATEHDLREIADMAKSSNYTGRYTEKALDRIEAYKTGLRTKSKRLLTRFKTFNHVTGGLRSGSVAIIGAYPSMGKTALALNIAGYQSEPVVFFSLEMTCEMIYERAAAAALGIDYSLFTSQRLSEEHYKKIEAFADNMKSSQVYVFDDAYYIERQQTIVSGIQPTLVVVDYVQKVRTHAKTDNRRMEIDYISGIYKQMAKDNHCVVLVLSQLTRADKSQRRPRPTMASLKESGALEADGDVIAILHRPYVMEKDCKELVPEDGYLLVDKNKFGMTGKIDLRFDGKYQRFYEVDKDDDRLKKKYVKNVPPPVDWSSFEEGGEQYG